MPVTALDEKTALVLIDLQKGIVGRPLTPTPVETVLENSAALVSAFHKAGLPVVVVNVIPPSNAAPRRNDAKMPMPTQLPEGFADIVPQIDVQDHDIRITKHTWNAFHNTALDEELKKAGVTGIVMAGVSSSIGVEGTARAAYERGYNLTFAMDAISDMNEKAHENSFGVIFPRMGEIDTTQAIVDKLGA